VVEILRDLDTLTARKPCSINLGPLIRNSFFCCSQDDPTGRVRMSLLFVRKNGIAAMMLAMIAIANVIKDVTAMEDASIIGSMMLDCNLRWLM
jgi:hypothetical protein